MSLAVTDGPEHGLVRDGSMLGADAVARGLAADPEIRAVLTAAIASSPHAAVFWETAPVSRASRHHAFRFVVRPAPTLAGLRPTPQVFAPELAGVDRVGTIPNLGGDALLVVPHDLPDPSCGAHLASFLRRAPDPWIEALWREVGVQTLGWLDARTEPVWVSTSGLGVAWLHVRLDTRPKYYGHSPFCRPPPAEVPGRSAG